MKRAEEFLQKVYKGENVEVRSDLSEAFLWALDNVPERVSVYHNNSAYKEYTKMYFFGGYTLDAIGKTFGVGRERVRQVILRTTRILSGNFKDLFKVGLTAYKLGLEEENRRRADESYISIEMALGDTNPRLYSVLKRAGYNDLASIYHAYAEGSLRKIRNLGNSSYKMVLSILKKYGYKIKEEV